MGFSLNTSFWLQILLVLLGGDVEIHPDPKCTRKVSSSICHWNLNSISVHNYVNLSVLKAYLAFHKFDNICLSEIYLNSSNSPDDETSEISGYNLVHSDHPLNSKRAGVCIYYKNYLPLRIISVNYLSECINFEIMIGNKICNFITLYRSPSQNQDGFQAFIDNLEINLETLVQRNLFLMVVIGDFNAKSKYWCSQDSTNFEGVTIEIVISQFGLSQIIKEATHILESSSSCIDLIFTTQPNLFTHHYIQIVTIKLYSQNLIYRYIIHHHTHEKSGMINKQILNLSDGQLLTFVNEKVSSATLY